MKLRAAGSRIVLLTMAGIFSLGSLQALAVPPSEDDTADAPRAGSNVRAVRLSNVEGGVQVVQDGQVIADPALANQPLFEGSQVLTANDGQAEVQLEDGSLVRISPNSTLTFSVMQKQGTGTRTEIVLNGGLVYFELQPSTAENSLRVNYGRTSFTASSFSVIRIMDDVPPGELAVFSGNVHLEHGGSLQLDIHGGESLSLNSADGSGYNISETIEQNSWDSWNADRDQLLSSQAADKTPATGALGNAPGVGMGDLDANGSWYDVPGQGYIWSPYDAQAVGAAWDPYGYGHWVFYPRRGYVWVSGYGWGYAPYLCGLWNFYDGFGWGWAPGTGCNGFWGGGGGFYGGGFYGDGGGWYNIGRYPRGYNPPKRPMPGPIHPRGGPVRPAGRVAASVVAVDRRPSLPTVERGAGAGSEPVTIAGHVVEPLRPVVARPVYDRPGASSFAGGGGSRSGYVVGGHPSYPGSGVRPGGNPGYRPQPSQSSHPASSPRPSSGGGGGGGHASMGGGGGGGGSHPSGGGGGSPHK
jgi:hypothetical protein